MNLRWMSACLISLVATGVSAQESPEAESTVLEARAAFDDASLAFDAGRFEYALERFSHAHELTGRPALLYNIGLTLERLQRPDEALDALEGYLRQAPDAPNRGSVEGRIVALRSAIAERRALEDELAAARAAERANEADAGSVGILDDPPEREDRVVAKWWLWTIVGLVVVGAGVGVAVAVTRDGGVQQPLPGDEGVVVSTLRAW